MTESDWDLLARWNNDPEVLWFSEGDHVKSRPIAEVRQVYRGVSQAAFCFIIEVDGLPIGDCWLQKMNMGRILSKYPGKDCRRIDLQIGEKNLWGRGYGTDVIKTLTRFGFEAQAADMIFGLVYDYNPRSLRAFAKAGYVEDQRVEEPPGRKARWACDLVLRKENFCKGRENPPKNFPPQVSPGRTVPRER